MLACPGVAVRFPMGLECTAASVGGLAVQHVSARRYVKQSVRPPEP